MYTIYPSRGIVVRTADGVQVAPTGDDQSQDYLNWLAWCDAGNAPTLGLEEQTATVRVVSKLAFRRLFTQLERIAFDGAPSNIAIPAEYRAALVTMQKDIDLALEIDLDDLEIIAGLTFLEQLGIIAPGRADEVRA